MEPKNLKGAVSKGKIGARDGDGNIVDPDVAIFPILKQTTEGLCLIGTGFFIAENGIFATAKHVLLDVIDENGNQTHPIVLIQFLGGSCVIRPILRCTSHDIADISVGIAAQMNHDTSGLPLKNKILRLTPIIPTINEVVCTYAYPKSTIQHGEIQKLYFYPDFFDGSIEELYPNGRDRILLPGPCVQTNMYIHGGASGGPVFDPSGKVFDVNSTGFENDDLSFITPIHLIENLLLENIFIPGNNSGRVRVQELIEGAFISYE